MIDVELYNGDCLELMSSINDGSVDMILCDLPYGMLNKTNSLAKWDSQIDLDRLFAEYDRIIKSNGAIVLFGAGAFTAELITAGKKIYRYSLVWDKVQKTGFLNCNRMPLRQHEDICIFYKKLPIYHPQMIPCEPHKRNHSKGKLEKPYKNSCYGEYVEVPTVISDVKYPSSIISISKEHCNGKLFHPTQKPIELLEWLIKTYTNEGDVVLDNCMGSGSTGVAAVNTGRNFIGIELDENYFQVAKERINEVYVQQCLPL